METTETTATKATKPADGTRIVYASNYGETAHVYSTFTTAPGIKVINSECGYGRMFWVPVVMNGHPFTESDRANKWMCKRCAKGAAK